MESMNRTGIPWADYSWNPIVGCSPASDGCQNCYAAGIAHRFHRPWGSPSFVPERINQPRTVKKSSRIFVCSVSDIGHPGVDSAWRESILTAIWGAPWHTFLILTKRPGDWMRPFANHAWLGVTCERQARVDERWGVLSQIQAQVRFVSVEPMLEDLTFDSWSVKPDWVIAGPETGRHARPCHDEWIEDLAAESPCFFDKRPSWSRREYPA